jgi:VWFA-related protein
MIRRAAAAALVLLLSGFVRAQTPPQSQPRVETFPTSANIVLVDFVVTDRNDRAVSGLTAKDFVVKEDGKERKIVSFAAFGTGLAAAVSADEGVPPPPPALAVTVVVIDDGNLTAEEAIRLRPALRALLSVVGRSEGGLALIAPRSNVSAAAALPDGIEGIRDALKQVVGHRMIERQGYLTDVEAQAVDRGDRAATDRLNERRQAVRGRDIMPSPMGTAQVRGEAAEALLDARRRRDDLYGFVFRGLDWLGTKSGRRSLILISDGFAQDPNDITREAVITRSLQVNAPVHYVDPRALPGISRFQGIEQQAALELNAMEGPLNWSQASEGATALAVDTGGVVVQGTNDMAKGLTRVLESMRTYYVIGYEPGLSKKAGYRKIRVETRLKDVKILARRGYLAEASEASR